MLKLRASYGKKIPVDGTDFSSHGYQAEVEVELPTGLSSQQLQERIHSTFELVRRSVDDEFSSRPTGNGAAPARSAGAGSNSRPPRPEPPATPKQLQFLADIATRRQMTRGQLNAEAERLYGTQDIDRLSRKQASELIDSLQPAERQGQQRKAA